MKKKELGIIEGIVEDWRSIRYKIRKGQELTKDEKNSTARLIKGERQGQHWRESH